MNRSLARIGAAAVAILAAAALCAQGVVQQIGPVTSGHLATWWQNGQITDGGAIPSLIGPNTWTAKQTFGPLTNGQAPINIVENTTPTTLVNGDIWTTTSGLFARIEGTSQGPFTWPGGTYSWTGKQTFAASTTSNAGVNLPQGTAPTSPVNGDVWTTSNGLYARINDATVGPITPTGALNVQTYGALGTGPGSAAADTAAFQGAIAAACAAATGISGVVEVDVPVPPVSYYINTTLVVCSNLHIHGVGMPMVTFTGSGALFSNTNAQFVEIDHLDMEGSNAPGSYGIRHPIGGTSALHDYYHNNYIRNFGNGSSGAGISIEYDSGGNLRISDSFLFNGGYDIYISAPTDGLHIYDNTMGESEVAVNAINWCVYATGALGASTQWIDHNLFECDGGGAIYINSNEFWIVSHNEEETSTPLLTSHKAEYDFEAGAVEAIGNIANTHGHATYQFYVGDGVASSQFTYNTGADAITNMFRVGSGAGNYYAMNDYAAGPASMYSRDYPGIMNALLPDETSGVNFGCGTTIPTSQFTVCGDINSIDPSTSASSINSKFLTPGLATSYSANFVLGKAFTTNNGVNVTFNNVGGSGSSTNTMQLGLLNGGQVTVKADGSITSPATVTGASYVAGSTAGVTCSGAPTASFASVNGIVTHC